MAIDKAIQLIRFKSKQRPDRETILDHISKSYKAFMNEAFECMVNDGLIEDRGENETESSFFMTEKGLQAQPTVDHSRQDGLIDKISKSVNFIEVEDLYTHREDLMRELETLRNEVLLQKIGFPR